jgi:hypothetical protein
MGKDPGKQEWPPVRVKRSEIFKTYSPIDTCGICHKSVWKPKAWNPSPFCQQHIEYAPYVQKLLATIDKMEKEVENVETKGIKAIQEDSIVLKDIRSLLCNNFGREKIVQLGRCLKLKREVVLVYVKWLINAKEVYFYSKNEIRWK